MKLWELKPGMRVLRKDWVPGRVVEVIGIGKTCAFLREGSTEYLYREDDDWIIVEPRKKPSEIIRESTAGHAYLTSGGNCAIGGCQENAIYANDRIDAILKYLDEQALEKK